MELKGTSSITGGAPVFTAVLSVLAALLALTGVLPGPVVAAEEIPQDRSWMLLEADSGRTLLQHNPRERRPVASLTKLMTALLTREYLEPGREYNLSESERGIYGKDSFTRRKLLEIMLIPSNNLATRVAGRLVSGSVEDFVDLMNLKAGKLGMKDTVFANPSGLPDSDPHYSTAADLKVLLEEFIRYPELAEISRSDAVELNGVDYDHTLTTLRRQVPGVNGFKTGWTRAAGRCYILELGSGRSKYHLIWLGSDSRATGRKEVSALAERIGLTQRASTG